MAYLANCLATSSFGTVTNAIECVPSIYFVAAVVIALLAKLITADIQKKLTKTI